ncbi:hypothetical protein FN846DRAFT_772638 [Sphaerosporella brunnea]|uniref:Conserved oligomeric Golgi complex subunit 1 n=1 Tax=Sphaerosporella brunnea TaxID=1250544 RepID=A0A5J5F8H6_9PEZI|nr:hypothetical protein FN846DRAFT_772638 [Sphaerosporella brunnea]
MSVPTIDPSSIGSWEDAFQHPIPQVRQLERQLRADLASNKEKLRGLVGESYRDLLQTAERIIDMDLSAQDVEAHLGDASRNCNSRLLERKARNLRTFNDMMDQRGIYSFLGPAADREKYTFAAQLSVLQACPSVISWLLHRDQGTACLLAAKVFVISRLLLKSLSEKSSLPLLSALGSQCSTLRPILLQHVDTLLSSSTLTNHVLVSTLTAFSVLKTSSPAEVLRHFLYIRSTALSSVLTSNTPDSILKAIRLLNKTISDADAIFPGKLSDALVALKAKSLLQDTDVLAVPELGLDINARWLPDDIRGYIPWVRHDDLETTRVQEQVRTWADKEISKLNDSLQATLDTMSDLSSIVKLRSGLLSLWRTGAQLRRKFQTGDNTSENFRGIVMLRVVAVTKSVAEDLQEVAEKASSLLPEADHEPEDSTSLWPSNPLPIDLTAGALSFRTTISNRVHGRSPLVLSFLTSYNTWLARISTTASILRDLRTASIPPEAAEDEDFEAEEERLQAGSEDSLIAERELSAALDGVYHLLERAISDFVTSTPPPTCSRAVFLLRITRQIRSTPPKRAGDEAPLLSLSWFGVDAIPTLHSSITADVAAAPLQTAASLFKRRKWEAAVPSRRLWEGSSPPTGEEGGGGREGSEDLPTQPSPLVFRFLHELVSQMRAAGEDVWTPAAIKSIKADATNGIWSALEEALQEREFLPDEAAREGREDADQGKQKGIISRDWTLQLLFDCLYLDEALHRKRRRGSSNGSSVASLVGKVDSLNLDEELRIRLEGAASEYWKRTCLLFALLS